MEIFQLAQHYFSPIHQYREQVESLNHSVEGHKALALIARMELEDLKAEVAAVIPAEWNKVKPTPQNYMARRLASAVQAPSSPPQLVELSSKMLMQSAKRFFQAKDYLKARDQLEKLNRYHSYSVYTTEANFLLVEINYQLQQYDRVVQVAQQMVNQFPESELTGYALLRLGGVFEIEDRPEDAVQIYKIVSQSFPYPALRQQAILSMRNVQL